MHTPYGLALDKRGNLYVSELEGCRARKIDSRSMIATVAGRGKCEFSGDGGPATAAGLAQPAGLAVDTDGSLYIVGAIRVRKVDSNGVITTVAGANG